MNPPTLLGWAMALTVAAIAVTAFLMAAAFSVLDLLEDR